MKTVYKKSILTLFILAIISPAYSDSLNFTFSQGSGQTLGKNLEASYRLTDSFVSIEAVAGLLNTGNIQGGANNFHAGYNANIRVINKGGFVFSVSQGFALLSNKTSRLGHHIQYPTTINIGLVDNKGNSVSLYWKHFSSGKISTRQEPNLGQEYIGITVGVSL